jgi:Domain of unknown function (DUF4440)
MAREQRLEPRKTFLVEHYRPGRDVTQLSSSIERIREIVAEMERAGKPVRYLFVTLKLLKPISVRVFGDHAVARVQLQFKVVAHGQTVQHQGWTTDLWQRHDGRWKLVWSQSTATPDHLDLFIRSLQP